MKIFLKNKIIHSLFETTILFKGINGLWEILVGVSFYFFKTETIYNAIIAMAGEEIEEGHFFANYFINLANDFSLNTKAFLAFYFLFYGILNIFLVVFLLKGKLWAYPLSIACFSFFIIYQFYRFFLYGSGLLLFFTLFDIGLVVLTWMEYKRIKNGKSRLPSGLDPL